MSNVSVETQSPNINNFARCATIEEALGAAETRSIPCLATGRYLIIQIEQTSQALSLCEVKVYKRQMQLDENIALGRPAFQVSYRYNTDAGLNSVAGLAVDGNMDSEYSKGTCSHTDGETNPWWAVDLGKTFKLKTVEIANRLELRE